VIFFLKFIFIRMFDENKSNAYFCFYKDVR